MLTDGRLRILIRANGQQTKEEVALAEDASMLHWSAQGGQ
jgi:hypothetical protein